MVARSSLHDSMRGFTLVELMVTIAILAILASLAAPSISKLQAKQHLNSSARNLASTLTLARSQSALLNAATTVKLDSADVDTKNTFNWLPSGRSDYKSSTTSVVFLANGTVDGNPPITLKLCDANDTYARTITITIMGTVKQTEGAC